MKESVCVLASTELTRQEHFFPHGSVKQEHVLYLEIYYNFNYTVNDFNSCSVSIKRKMSLQIKINRLMTVNFYMFIFKHLVQEKTQLKNILQSIKGTLYMLIIYF
jgi:hypothetical protein